MASFGPVLTAVAEEQHAATTLAHGWGVLHVVLLASVAETVQVRPDLVDIVGADQAAWVSGLFETVLGTAGGGTSDDVDWDALVTGADRAVDAAINDPDLFLATPMVGLLDTIGLPPTSDDTRSAPDIDWHRSAYLDAVATATFVAFEDDCRCTS